MKLLITKKKNDFFHLGKFSRQPNALTKLHFPLIKQQNRTKNQQNPKTEKAESQKKNKTKQKW